MFKIKLSTVLSIAAGVGVAVTGYLAARGGKKAAKIEAELEELRLDDVDLGTKLKATWKCYIPAFVAGIMTLGCGAYAKRLDTKEIIKLAGALGVATSQLKKVTGDFNLYREAVVDKIGPEKEAEIRQEVSTKLVKNNFSGLEQREYVFRIDWAGGKEMFFKATPMEVMMGIAEINRLLNDYGVEPHAGCPSVSDFLYFISQNELVCEETDNACWTEDECREMDQWWVHAELVPYDRQDFNGNQEAEYYDIWIDMYPNGCIENAEINLERAGTL